MQLSDYGLENVAEPGMLLFVKRGAPIFHSLQIIPEPQRWMFSQPRMHQTESNVIVMCISTKKLRSYTLHDSVVDFVISGNFVGWVNNEWNMGEINYEFE